MKCDSKPRKFKFNKKFRPLPVDAEDELFPNGIFEFNISKLLAFLKSNPSKFPVVDIDLKTVKHEHAKSLDESTVKKADLSAPIIVAEISPGRFNVIDGNHRVERAFREGVAKVPGYKVDAPEHLAFLTSERAYQTYIDYWNTKVDDGIAYQSHK